MKHILRIGVLTPLLVLIGGVGAAAATDNITNLVFTLAPSALTAGQGERFEVELRNANNQAESLSNSATLELDSTSATGEFASGSEATCGSDWSLANVPFGDGSVRQSFCYRDTVNGSATLTATINGQSWTAATALVTLSGGSEATTTATSTDDTDGNATTTDDTAPLVTAMVPSNVTTISADIMLSLTEPATAIIWYATSTPVAEQNPLSTAPSTSPTVPLSGLSAGTRYYFFATVSDTAGNTSTSSTQSFKTKSTTASSTDLVAPTVMAVYPLDLTSTSTRLVVETDDAPFFALVSYGLAPGVDEGQTFTSDEVRSEATSTSLQLKNLTASSTYYYYVTVWDESDNESRSSTQSFRTLPGVEVPAEDDEPEEQNNDDDDGGSSGGGGGGISARGRALRLAANRGQVLGAFTGTPNGGAAIGFPNTGGFLFSVDLGMGMSGAAVTALQERFTSEGVYQGPITGYFGTLTEAAVRAYQRAHSIAPTGFVGPLTRAALNQTASANRLNQLTALQSRLQQLWNLLAVLGAQPAQADTTDK